MAVSHNILQQLSLEVSIEEIPGKVDFGSFGPALHVEPNTRFSDEERLVARLMLTIPLLSAEPTQEKHTQL